MAGMSEVGRLFNANELIVAEVLQSAEAMKAAVNYLEGFMEKAETSRARQDRARHGQRRRPRHRQEPGRDHPQQQRLRRDQSRDQGAVRSADSGVPGAQAGRDRALGAAGEERAADGYSRRPISKTPAFSVPVLVGGAALSERFTRQQDRAGLRRGRLLRERRHDRAAPDEQIMDPAEREALLAAHRNSEAGAFAEPSWKNARRRVIGRTQHESARWIFRFLPRPISTGKCATCRNWPSSGATSIRSCFSAGIWATKATSKRIWRAGAPKALELNAMVEELKSEAAAFMKVKAVWQFFEAEREGNSIHLFAPGSCRASSHIPFRTPAARQRPLPERLYPAARRTAGATTWRCSWSRPARAFASDPKR